MQGQVNNEKPLFIMLSIPYEVMEDAEISAGNIIQIASDRGKIVIERVNEPDDFICSGDCEACPFADTDLECSGECDDCPCRYRCDEKEDN